MMAMRNEDYSLALMDLPEFVIQEIVRNYLPGPSIAALAATCKKSRVICSRDIVWKNRCKCEYQVDRFCRSTFSCFRELYITLLHPYGWILGLWKIDTFPFGGLVKMKFSMDSIVAEKFSLPRNADLADDMVRVPLFRIQRTSSRQGVIVKCVVTINEVTNVHNATIEKRNETVDDNGDVSQDTFTLVCHDERLHLEQDHQERYPFWVRLQLIGLNRGRKSRFSRVHFDLSEDSTKIFRQGLFKGTYGGHGVELIYIHDSNNGIEGLKMSGDPNIPAGKVSFRTEDKIRWSLFEACQMCALDPNQFSDANNQRFRCPPSFMSSYAKVPEFYKGCFVGEGQVANSGYVEPRWIPVIIVIFTDELIGVIWIALQSLSLYIRVQDSAFKP